jgi:hypothetical protein
MHDTHSLYIVSVDLMPLLICRDAARCSEVQRGARDYNEVFIAKSRHQAGQVWLSMPLNERKKRKKRVCDATISDTQATYA